MLPLLVRKSVTISEKIPLLILSFHIWGSLLESTYIWGWASSDVGFVESMMTFPVDCKKAEGGRPQP